MVQFGSAGGVTLLAILVGLALARAAPSPPPEPIRHARVAQDDKEAVRRAAREAERRNWGSGLSFSDEQLDILIQRRKGEYAKQPGAQYWKELTRDQASLDYFSSLIFANGHVSPLEAFWLFAKASDFKQTLAGGIDTGDPKMDDLLRDSNFRDFLWCPGLIRDLDALELALVALHGCGMQEYEDSFNAYMEKNRSGTIEGWLKSVDAGMPQDASDEYKKQQATIRARRVHAKFLV